MNRREFIKNIFTAGLVVAAPKIIFDLAPKSYKRTDAGICWSEKFINEPSLLNPEALTLLYKQLREMPREGRFECIDGIVYRFEEA